MYTKKEYLFKTSVEDLKKKMGGGGDRICAKPKNGSILKWILALASHLNFKDSVRSK